MWPPLREAHTSEGSADDAAGFGAGGGALGDGAVKAARPRWPGTVLRQSSETGKGSMMTNRVDVAFVLVVDPGSGRVLLVRNAGTAGTWSLPGGRREPAETLAEAAVREAKEETGAVVVARDVVHVSERIDGDVHDVFTVFRGELVAGEPTAPLGDEDVRQVAWMPVQEASTLMPWYRDGVAALLDAGGAGYSTDRE